jgi:hypothetical protein
MVLAPQRPVPPNKTKGRDLEIYKDENSSGDMSLEGAFI